MSEIARQVQTKQISLDNRVVLILSNALSIFFPLAHIKFEYIISHVCKFLSNNKTVNDLISIIFVWFASPAE